MLAVAIYIKDVDTLEYNRVDLFDDENISVTSSIQNINDISKTFTDFSQTFTVPASKQNNKIFRHWYDNSNDAPFSTLVKSDAYIEIDTITFRKGKIQLESANLEDGQAKDYSITFIGTLGNLKDTFAGKMLKDLTSTTYDFNYTSNEVLSRVVDSVASRDVMFPLISSNRVWNVNPITFNDNAINWSAAPIRYNELFPALRLRAVLNMIEERFGINFDGTLDKPSTFLSDARFTNAYLWLKNAEEFIFKATYDIITFQNISVLTSSGVQPLNLFKVPPLVNNEIYTNNLSNIPPNGIERYIRYLSITITPTSPNIIYTIKIYENNNLILTQEKTSIVGSQVFSQIIVNKNSNIRFEITAFTPMTFNASVLLTSENTSTSTNSYVTQTISKSSNQTTSSPKLAIKSYMPEIKIEDFFSGLLKMFNLTCYSEDGINYTIEQLENYYLDGSDIDITKYVIQDKKNLNRVKTYKKINFDYEKSESVINVGFNSTNGIEYGSLHYSNTPPAEGEEYSIKLPFENLNFSNLLQSSLFQVGYALKTDYQKYIPKPIILYDYNSAGTTNAGFTFYTSGALIGNGDPRTTYKAFGQETLISSIPYSLNFNEQQSTLTNLPVEKGLYNQYYSAYFNNIYNFKARLVKVSAILPTSILTTLKLNDNVIIRDTKYLINTFTTDLTTGEVQFELLTDQRQW